MYNIRAGRAMKCEIRPRNVSSSAGILDVQVRHRIYVQGTIDPEKSNYRVLVTLPPFVRMR